MTIRRIETNAKETIAHFMAKDMLEHMSAWRKRIYRLRKNAKEFLVYKGDPNTYIPKEYPQGVDVPMYVVEDIWHDVCIGNVVMDKIDHWFNIHWYASIEDLGQDEQWNFISELVVALYNNFGGDGSMDEMRKELAQSKRNGRARFSNGEKDISIPNHLLKRLVFAIDNHDFYVEQDENGEHKIFTTLSKGYFFKELLGEVA